VGMSTSLLSPICTVRGVLMGFQPARVWLRKVKREEEMGMDPDKYREVFDLAQRGARAFRDGHFDEAVSFYSKAQTLRPGDPIILSNRSSAFCMISQVLRERSAADSEYQPLNGLDPTTHAEVALKDAEKVLAIGSNSPRPYLLKAYALILVKPS
jgi:tetratricopeptide (TPR) repeat protein